jgi:TonB family protein
VELDGVSLPGLSPFVTNGVALGSHEIRVRREGHADWIRVVRLGEEDLHLVVALKELPTAAATLESVPGEPSMGYEKTPLGVRPVPHVSQEQAKVKGALDKDIIRRIVRAHTNEIRYCYNQGLVRDPKLSGRAVLKFTIGPDGNVLVAVVKESTISDPDVGTCMVKAVKRWKFPKPDGGGNVVVEYPFVLTSE